MIVNYTEDGWSIITQRAHGLLAAQICAHWKNGRQPKRWVETLIATAEHDDGPDELSFPELNPETGGPKNFKTKGFDPTDCDRLLSKGLAKGRYIGLLIASHIHFLYQNDPSAKAYCHQLSKLERQWRKDCGSTKKEIADSYLLLQFCDAFSLIICQNQIPPEKRHLEISKGPDRQAYMLSITSDKKLKVAPWPFEPSSFEVNYESRFIKQLSFETAEQFRDMLECAKVVHHILTITS